MSEFFFPVGAQILFIIYSRIIHVKFVVGIPSKTCHQVYYVGEEVVQAKQGTLCAARKRLLGVRAK
jgi:hypothetical protein